MNSGSEKLLSQKLVRHLYTLNNKPYAISIRTMPRVIKPSKPRHDPLHLELEGDEAIRKFGRVAKPGKRKAKKDEADDDEPVSRDWKFVVSFNNLTSITREPKMPECQKRFWILQGTSRKKLLESLDRMMIGKMKRRQKLNREDKLYYLNKVSADFHILFPGQDAPETLLK